MGHDDRTTYYVDERVAVRNDSKQPWMHGSVAREGGSGKDGARVQLPSEKRDECFAHICRLPAKIIVKHAGDWSGDYLLSRDFEGDYSVWVRDCGSKDPPCLYFREKNEQWALAANSRGMRDLEYELLEQSRDRDTNTLHPGDSSAADLKWVNRDQRTQREVAVAAERKWHPPKWAKGHPDLHRQSRKRGSSSDSGRRRRRRSSGSGSGSRRRRRRGDSSDSRKRGRRTRRRRRDSDDGESKKPSDKKADPEDLGPPGELVWQGDDVVVLEEVDKRDRSVRVLKAGARKGRSVDDDKVGPKVRKGWKGCVHAVVDPSQGQRPPRGTSTRERDGGVVVTVPADGEGSQPWMTAMAPFVPPRGRSLWTVRVERLAHVSGGPRLDEDGDEPGGLTLGFAPPEAIGRRAAVAAGVWDPLPADAAFVRNPRRNDPDATVGVVRSRRKDRIGALADGDELRILVDRPRRTAYFCRGLPRGRRAGDWEMAAAEKLPPEGMLGFFCFIPPGCTICVSQPLEPAGDAAEAVDLSRLAGPAKAAVRDLAQYLELIGYGERAPRDDVRAAGAIAEWAAERESTARRTGTTTRALPADAAAPANPTASRSALLAVVLAAAVMGFKYRRPFDVADPSTWRGPDGRPYMRQSRWRCCPARGAAAPAGAAAGVQPGRPNCIAM